MSQLPRLRPYRRLGWLLAASLAFHGLLLEGMALLGARSPAPAAPAPVRIRLVPAAATSGAAAQAPPAAPMPPAPLPSAGGVSENAPLAATAPAKSAPPVSPSADAAAPPRAPVSPRAASAAAQARGLPVDQGQTAPLGDDPPARYRLMLPPPATIEYSVWYAPSAQARATPAGQAALDWAPDTDSYRLTMGSGDLAAAPAHSSGILGDDGILPVEASDGRAATRFDRDNGQIVFAHGAPQPMQRGVQDPLSVLIQLAAIGAANPAQLEQGVELFVGGMGDAGVVRIVSVGAERVDTPAGSLATVHLTQVARPGTPRLDVWLAPAHHWLPVKLQTTAADGSLVIQVARKVGAPADAPHR